nr:MAG TPA_asm: Protein of unknown function (DUF779) [Caudoviricetes sp.]
MCKVAGRFVRSLMYLSGGCCFVRPALKVRYSSR